MEIARLQIAVDATGARAAKAEIRDMTKAADAADSSVSALVKSAAGLAIFGTAAAAVSTAVKASRDFNQAISQLSSITGAVGQDLAFYEKQAKLIGQTTTLSASQAADAFKLIASAKPDLLASRDALASVTKEAVALAEAAGTSLPDAAKALGNSLNQFGADASEASRYINVLAAGAKFGSSSIEDTTAALKASGSAARAVGATFEQANAAIQALAKGGIAGAEAGTNLRNVLLKLEADTDDRLRPSIVGVTQAIQNLSKEQLTVTELSKKFGLESVVAAQTLIDNADAVGQLEKALTGTNTAYEQASTNNDNLAGDQLALQSATESLAIAFGQKLDPAVRDSTQTMTAAVLKITDSIDAILVAVTGVSVLIAGKFVGSLAASASALIAQSVAAARATVTVDTHGMAIARTTVAANAGAIASRGLAAAMSFMGGPIGLAVSGVTMLVMGIKSYQERAIMAGKETREFTHSINQMGDAASRAQERFAGLLAGMQNMTKVELEGKLTQLEGQLKTVLAQGKSFERMFERGVGTQAMIDGNTAAAALLIKEIDKVKLSLNGQAGAAKLSDAEMKTAANSAKAAAKEASALGDSYQSLYDSLYPAEAAQRQYNEQVALLSKYLTGDKLANAIKKLNESVAGGDHDEVAKSIEAYRKEVEALEDRLDPVGKATKQYQKDVALLASAHERGELSGEKYALMLKNLEEDYKKASESSSDWGQFTQRALDSVDQAFADAWKNIDKGFSGFADGLKNAFKNMLAELAHMAITKPIIVQLSSMLGIGGAQGQGQGGGLLSGISSLFGGGSGSGGSGGGLGGIVGMAQNAYSLYQAATGQGFLGSVVGGFQSGGFGGALSGGASWAGNAANGLYSAGAGLLGYGGAASSAIGATQAGYTGAQFAAWSAAQGGAGAAGAAGAGAGSGLAGAASAWPLAVIMGMIQSGKLYDAGVRPDASAAWAQGDGSAASKAFNVAPTFQAKQFEFIDGILEPLVGGKLAAIISGSTFSQALWGGISKALFGGGWENKNFGYELGATGGDFTARQYQDQKKKGGLFSSSKSRTKYSELDPEAMAGFQDMYDATRDGVSDLFAGLGISIEESSLDGLTIARKKIKTKGKTEEEIQAAIMEWFGTAAEAMNAELNKVFGTGLDYDLAGMQAFVGNLQGVNAILESLRLEAFDTSVAGGKLAESLSAAAGGLEALANNTNIYYGAFFTEAEKLEDQLGAIKKAFEDADVEMVSSRQAYRAMVEDIDLTTEAGQQMFATMMQLSGTAAQYFDILEAQASAAAQAAQASLLGSVSGAYGQLQRSIQTERDRLTQNYQAQIAAEQAAVQARTNAYADMIDTANSNVQAMRSLDSALSRALSTLLGTSETAVQMVRKQAVELLQDAVNIGRSGRSVSAISGLEDALDSASRLDTDVYSTLADFEREQGRTANLISELQGINGKQLTTEEKLLEQLRANSIAVQNSITGVTDAITAEYERAMQALEEELTAAQAQLDALNGIDNSVLSVAAAVAQMSAAVTAAINGMTGGEGLADTIKGLYLSILGTNANQQGVDFWSNRIGEGGNFTELVKELQQAAFGKVGTQNAIADLYKQSGTTVDAQGLAFWEQAISSGQYTYDDLRAGLGIPGFASGGMHSGGVRLVGENGPEIEVTGPSRIYSANQTASMLAGGSEQAEEVRIAMSDIMNGLRAIAKNTMKTASGIERQNQIGVPDQGVIA